MLDGFSVQYFYPVVPVLDAPPITLLLPVVWMTSEQKANVYCSMKERRWAILRKYYSCS